MSHAIRMEIAGVGFSIYCNDPVILQQDRAYQEFFTADGPMVSDININLVTDSMPEIGAMTKIFDSSQSWAMYRGSDGFYMTYHPPAFKAPFWRSMIHRDLDRVTVYCGEELVQEKNGHKEVLNPVRYPLDQIILLYYLSRRSGILVHAAGMEICSKGYLFAGRSGAGKSTLSGLFSARQGVVRFSDDRMVIRKTGDTYMAFGTPWPGEGGIADNRGVPLSGIFFLTHGDTHGIETLTVQKAIELFLPVVSIPWYDQEIAGDILTFCEEIVYNIPAYRLFFTQDTGVTDVIMNHVCR